MAAANPFDISGKVAIVTGGAMGIGFGIARRFVESGAHVLLADVDEKAAHAALERLPSGPGKVQVEIADLAKDESWEALVRRCVESFGGVDVLVNNAGIYPMAPLQVLTPEIFDRVHQVNVRGLLFMAKAAAARMVEQGRGGSIINLASTASFHPAGVGTLAYASSKAAVNMLTRGLALELAPHKVRVNAIAPGLTETEGLHRGFAQAVQVEEQIQALLQQIDTRVPLGRRGTPEDMANAAVFLASSASAYMTGSTVVLDGGLLLV